MREDATSAETPALQARAMDNLDYIRSTMERASALQPCRDGAMSASAVPHWARPGSPLAPAKFWRGLGPPFLAGFLLTIGLFKAGQYSFLPGPFIPHDVHVEVADNLRSSEHIGLTLHLGGHPQVHDRTNAAGDELIHASSRDPVHLSGSQEYPPTRLVSISGRVPPEISNVGAPFQINVSIGMQEFVHQ